MKPSNHPEQLEETPSYSFLNRLSEDFTPELLDEIQTRLPTWQQEIDELFDTPGFSQALLSHIEYFTIEEVSTTCYKVAEEIQALLTANPNQQIGFISHVGNGSRSGKFFLQIVKEIAPDLAPNIIELTDLNLSKSATIPAHNFYLDDSPCSGQQLRDLFAEIRLATRRNPHYSPTSINLRFITCPHEIHQLVHEKTAALAQKHPCNFTLTYSAKMPTWEEFITKFESTHGPIDFQSAPISERQFSNLAGRVLGFFPHKVQDWFCPLLAYEPRNPHGSRLQLTKYLLEKRWFSYPEF